MISITFFIDETIFEMTMKISHDLATIWFGQMKKYLNTTSQNKTTHFYLAHRLTE